VSTVGHGPVAQTLMGGQRFTDEDGIVHDHDPNTFGAEHWCSMGHRWYQRWTHTCWCGYGADRDPFGGAYEEIHEVLP
jgi:hypothetical protein